jgi:hypothetical protein
LKDFRNYEGVDRLEDEEYSENQDPLGVDLDDIEGKDPARARFIRGYLKAST